MDQLLFDAESLRQGPKRQLVISKARHEKLSKQQQTFNRLIKKIEDLRAEMWRTTTMMDGQLEYHSKHIYPIEQETLRLRRDVLKLLFPFYKNKKQLSQNQRSSLSDLLRGLLRDIVSTDTGKPDEEIKEIFEAVEGERYEEAFDRDFASMKEDMERMFREQGVDVNLDDMHKDMGQEEMARKMKEIQEEIMREQEKKGAQKNTGKKTKKQQEKIEKERLMEEARNKNIGNIYKQLVKALHPDLEKDDARRPMKEELMKQLSIAYKNNDLHGLLKLELEWINKEESDTQKLTDDKLDIYNEVLKEQVKELELQIDMIFDNPRYEPLAPYINPYLGAGGLNLSREKQNMEMTLKSLQNSIENLKGANPIREIKELLAIQKRYIEDMDFLEFI